MQHVVLCAHAAVLLPDGRGADSGGVHPVAPSLTLVDLGTRSHTHRGGAGCQRTESIRMTTVYSIYKEIILMNKVSTKNNTNE